MRVVLKSFLVAATALFIVGCGGGGIGGYGSSYEEPLFPDSARLADRSDSNALKVIDMLLSYNLGSNSPMLRQVSANSAIEKKNSSLATFAISQIKLVKENLTKKEMKAMKVINDTGECSNGGRYYKNGEITKENGGVVEYEYINCKTDDGAVYDGIQSVEVGSYDYYKNKFTKMNITYSTDFTVVDENGRYTILKGSKISTQLLDDGYIRVKTTIVSSQNGQKSGFKDVTFIIESFNEATLIYQTTGRIYINNLREYVELDRSYDTSETPLEFDNSNSVQNGEVHYYMRYGTLKIVIENGEISYRIE